jgi:hypothetical protein
MICMRWRWPPIPSSICSSGLAGSPFAFLSARAAAMRNGVIPKMMAASLALSRAVGHEAPEGGRVAEAGNG